MTASPGLAAALPQYEVGVEIGSGGMGVVFAGVHRSLGRQVAIKRLPAQVAGDPDVNERFDREARVLASLDHPHVVPVYDYVQTGADNLLVMEKLDGGTVHDAFRGRGLTGEQSCAIALATLAGLHAAHGAGVLHLDVKPKNLLFTAAGVVKVADFGIAQVVSEGATMMTNSGDVLGTPAYLAPEQALGNPLSPAADVYSAGTVLYELLCGELPFDRSQGAVALLRQRAFGEPAPLRGVPARLAAVVMRSVAREPRDRYPDAETFAVELGAAATSVFGAGWVERSRVPVHLGPRVLGAIASASAPEVPTIATRPVRAATEPERTRLIRPDELRPAHEVLAERAPAAPSRVPALVAGLLALLALVALVVLPLTAPAALAHPDAGTGLLLDGKPVSGAVPVDLSKPFTVSGNAGSPAPFVLAFELRSAAIPLGTVQVPMTPAADGAFTARVEPQAVMRWLVGGAATGSLRVGGAAAQEFTLRTPQHPLASALGGGALLLGLFALASVESLMRALRRSHRRPSAPVAAVPLGALLGASVWSLLSALLGHEPSTGVGIASAAAGAAAALLLVVTTKLAARA
ncbi:serine/threonine-protein kinase [Actinokineospora bangkokensis]|uniref:non-specific serine/threonine protein kinase n=1 Tax=Actinokineospora bangkokensis TaxID=1193682 RepID=A0A1Q9LCK0_9PSEU|nr:serine/threonine-protein kinase [Actinokineospora bangkokensis]OLR89735.1 serine/threonine protein kinase [Actinokineospora bangkokensis]